MENLNYLWIIPFSPLIASIIIGIFGFKFLKEPLSGIVAVIGVAISAVAAVIGFLHVHEHGGALRFKTVYVDAIRGLQHIC